MAKLNFGNAISGGLAGAQFGSSFGPYGAAAGALLGGAAGLFGSGSSRSRRKKRKPKMISTLDPQQQGLYKDYVSSLRGQGPMSDLFNYNAEQANNVFDQTIARPAYRGFQENIIPSITGQFRQGNLQNSSYAGQALSRAGRDVQEGLDSQRANYIYQGQQQQQANRQNALQNILGMQTFAYDRPQEQTPNTVDQILGSLAPKAGEWFADYLSNRRSGMPATSNTLQPGQAG